MTLLKLQDSHGEQGPSRMPCLMLISAATSKTNPPPPPMEGDLRTWLPKGSPLPTSYLPTAFLPSPPPPFPSWCYRHEISDPAGTLGLQPAWNGSNRPVLDKAGLSDLSHSQINGEMPSWDHFIASSETCLPSYKHSTEDT